jgi:predicted nuclease with TOPRIM domain
MAIRKTEPVRHTCPDIDRLKAMLKSIVNEMNDCKREDDIEDILSLISNWSSDLEGFGVGRWCELETLRSSNSSLRDWGHEMYDEAESLESERDELENEVSKLKDEIVDLESTISDLEDTVSEHSL